MVEGRRWAGPGSVPLQPASAQSGRVGGQLEHSGKGGGEEGRREGGRGGGRGGGRVTAVVIAAVMHAYRDEGS